MRFTSISILGLIAAAFASAGQIQIGGAAGLTYNYITQGSGAFCAAGAGNCIAGSTGGNANAPGAGTTGFVEKNFDARLFQAATESGTSPTPYTGYQQTAQWSTGGRLGRFAMIDDGTGANSNSNNFWDALSASTITIPVGINELTDVSLMMDNIWGTAGAQQTSVTFDFGATANATSGLTSVTVDLVNAGSPGSSASGQIGSGVDCSVALDPSCSSSTLAGGPLAATSIVNGIQVNTQNMFVTGNSYNTVAAGAYAGTAGTLSLYAQTFFVSQFENLYLVDVRVQEKGGASLTSQTALSALTVDQAPEPSTVLLFMSGLGALGLTRLRRRK